MSFGRELESHRGADPQWAGRFPHGSYGKDPAQASAHPHHYQRAGENIRVRSVRSGDVGGSGSGDGSSVSPRGREDEERGEADNVSPLRRDSFGRQPLPPSNHPLSESPRFGGGGASAGSGTGDITPGRSRAQSMPGDVRVSGTPDGGHDPRHSSWSSSSGRPAAAVSARAAAVAANEARGGGGVPPSSSPRSHHGSLPGSLPGSRAVSEPGSPEVCHATFLLVSSSRILPSTRLPHLCVSPLRCVCGDGDGVGVCSCV